MKNYIPLLLVAMVTTLGGKSLTWAERLGVRCKESGAFYCHDSDPTSFTRCIDNDLHVFHCPDGLHFNTLSQTCDWPMNADCKGSGGGYKHGGSSSSSSSSKQAASADWSSSGSASSGASSHGSGKPWWRPDDVDPKSWEDVNDLVEVPYDESEGEKSLGGQENSISSSSSEKGSSEWGSSEKGSSEKGSSEWGSSEKGSSEKGSSEWGSSERGKSNGQESKKQQSASSAGEKEQVASSASKKESGKSSGHSHPHGPAWSMTAEKRPELSNVQWHDGPCNPSECTLPSCRCPGTDIPGGLSPKKTPQMVMITFDDEVSAAYYGYFQRLFRPGRYNPNGCPVRGCLYVSGEGTDYDLVYPLYAMGVEVASHTLSHRFPHTWWATASYQEFVDEVEGMRLSLTKNAGVAYEAIRGFRVPFLQLGADNMYAALYDSKFTYDTSMFTGSVWEGSDPVWPFTLDYTVPEQYCQHGPCPLKQYPGLWEIPVQRWYGLDGHSCAMPDGCTASADAEEDLEFFRSNFRRYYESNRAPFGIFLHARWFHTEHHLDALDRFVDELLQLDDVYIVTPGQVVDWMRSPKSVDEVKYFQPWTCEGAVSSDKRRR